MKKIALYALLLATGLFAGCSDSYDDWADPQGYDPEDSELIYMDVVAAGAINMADVDGETVNLFTPAISLPEGAVVTGYKVTLDGTVTLDADEEGNVSASDLEAAVETLYGKRPEARTMEAVIKVYVDVDGQTLTTSSSTTVTVTLSAPFIASAYYLVGDFCGWDEESMIAFTHSDADVYDDPTFTVSFTATEGQYWKIIPQTNIDSGDFWHEGSDGCVGVAVDGDTSTSGQLVAIEGVGAGSLGIGGLLRMTINMMDYTYTIEGVASEYYLTGNPNSWSTDMNALFWAESSTTYSYTSYYNGSWDVKFWSVDNVGDWDNIYGCSAAEDNNGAATGTIVYSAGDQSIIGCITPASAGYYTLTIDMGAMIYSWEELSDQNPTEYDVMSITGDFNGWSTDEGTAVDMTQAAPHNWYVETTIPSDGGLKFLTDRSWTVNWGTDTEVSATGATYEQGWQDGSNITVPAGTYRIYLNDITGKFAFVAE